MRKKNIKLSDIDYLRNEKVRMKDGDKVEELINVLVNGGKERLQVISDFDMTITKQHENGKRGITSFGIFEVSHHLPPNYREKSKALFNKYYPIEVCHIMSVEEKIPHMIDWYKEAEKLLHGCHLTPEDIVEAVNETHTILRDGSEKMFKTLEDARIPVLVLSAGVGDVVAAVLRKHSVYQPNLTIVSNFLEFTQKGEVTTLEGFKGEFIHVFNKHTAGSGPNSHGESRYNVILLGDNIGDAGMAEVIQPSPEVVLKIGFLYEKIEERLASFLDHFDIVLIDDQTMDLMNSLLTLVLESE